MAPSYLLIPSRYPVVGLYDAIADATDLDAVFATEALANPRLRDELGDLLLVPPKERVTGPGATPVMAAFTHLNLEGSRFSDGTYGVYYAAHSLESSVAEVSHHRAAFMRFTNEPAIDLDMRLITAKVEAELHDLGFMHGGGAAAKRFAAALHPDDYGPSRRLGRALRDAGSWGRRWPSVRDAAGECVGIFRPRALRHAKAALHIGLHWGRPALYALVREEAAERARPLKDEERAGARLPALTTRTVDIRGSRRFAPMICAL